MKIEELKENVIRSEGYAEGFKAGYLACAQRVANELAKDESKVPASDGTALAQTASGGASGS